MYLYVKLNYKYLLNKYANTTSPMPYLLPT